MCREAGDDGGGGGVHKGGKGVGSVGKEGDNGYSEWRPGTIHSEVECWRLQLREREETEASRRPWGRGVEGAGDKPSGMNRKGRTEMAERKGRSGKT
jgi:hypothetical protein